MKKGLCHFCDVKWPKGHRCMQLMVYLAKVVDELEDPKDDKNLGEVK